MKKISLSTGATALSTLGLATIASAQTIQQTGQNVTNLFGIFGNLVNMAIGILVTLALAVFFWGLVKYIFHLGGDKGADQGKHLMIYGVIALFVMVSVWGLVGFLQSFFGVGSNPAGNVNTLIPQR